MTLRNQRLKDAKRLSTISQHNGREVERRQKESDRQKYLLGSQIGFFILIFYVSIFLLLNKKNQFVTSQEDISDFTIRVLSGAHSSRDPACGIFYNFFGPQAGALERMADSKIRIVLSSRLRDVMFIVSIFLSATGQRFA